MIIAIVVIGVWVIVAMAIAGFVATGTRKNNDADMHAEFDALIHKVWSE